MYTITQQVAISTLILGPYLLCFLLAYLMQRSQSKKLEKRYVTALLEATQRQDILLAGLEMEKTRNRELVLKLDFCERVAAERPDLNAPIEAWSPAAQRAVLLLNKYETLQRDYEKLWRAKNGNTTIN